MTMQNRDHSNYSMIEIGENTKYKKKKKRPGDIRKLSVTQIPVKDQQLTLVWRIREKWKNNNTNNRVSQENDKTTRNQTI